VTGVLKHILAPSGLFAPPQLVTGVLRYILSPVNLSLGY
jgi:hypothetical protein